MSPLGRQGVLYVTLLLAAAAAPALGADCSSSTPRPVNNGCYLDLFTDQYYRCEDGLNCERIERCRYGDGSVKACGICRTATPSNNDFTCDLPDDSPASPPSPPTLTPSTPPGSGNCMSTGTFSSQCSTPAVQELVRLNNELRASEGKAPLVCDNDLSAEAQRYSIDLCRQPTTGSDRTGNLSHTLCGEPVGPRCDSVEGGWTRCGENIAYNFQYDEASGTAVYDQWENSPGHRANMVGDFDTVGYGFHRCEADHRSNGRVEGSDRTYWTGLYVRKA